MASERLWENTARGGHTRRFLCYVWGVKSHQPSQDDQALMRVVGRRRPRVALCTSDNKARILAWRKAFPTPFVPRGVYRFDSHEAADQWLWEMLIRPRKG